jgi:uncharacterized protein
MHIGVLKIEFHLPNAQSLKDKRKVTKSLITKLRAKYNISIAEISYQDKWQRCVVAVACVSNGADLAHTQLNKILRDFDREGEIVVIDHSLEII